LAIHYPLFFMPTNHVSIAVLGGGVIGLTSAICLLEAGFQVTIFAKAITPHTTSDIAAAYWAPFAALADEPMRTCALRSLATFHQLAIEPAWGVVLTRLYELTEEPEPIPDLLPSICPVEPTPPGRFPTPWTGFCITVPRIDVPIYMPRLWERYQSLGGMVRIGGVQGFEDVPAEHDLLVNCTGLGAQALTGDTLFPIRGQIMRIRKPRGLAPDMLFATGANGITYIIPRQGDWLLGGTFQYGDSNTQVDETIAQDILRRCAYFVPALRDAEILEHRVGLRPGRHQVRLELGRDRSGRPIVHNYGHGSVGHTLSWGCAAEVTKLAQRVLHTAQIPYS
jgi:D-amino-acid oxidase